MRMCREEFRSRVWKDVPFPPRPKLIASSIAIWQSERVPSLTQNCQAPERPLTLLLLQRVVGIPG